MRITKDLTPLFVKKTKHEHPDADVENIEYLQVLRPSLDSFLYAFFPLKFSFLDLSIKLFIFLDNCVSFPFQEKREEITIKKISKKHKKGKNNESKRLCKL
jgi:hypothetical protein